MNDIQLQAGQRCEARKNSIAFGRRTLLVAVLIALLGSLLGESYVQAGQIHGTQAWLIASSLLVEISVTCMLFVARRRDIAAIAVFVIAYFACYLSAGVVLSAAAASTASNVFTYLLWFFPLLVLNRLVTDVKAAQYVERTLRSAPVVLLLLLSARLAHVLPATALGLMPVYLLTYVLFGCMLQSVTRYREAYLSELAQNATLSAEQRAFEWATLQDPLTGLPTRDHLHDVVAETLSSLPPGRGGALILISVEGLRGLNYAFGHTAGDRLLLMVAKRLRKRCPEDGLLARWGNANFALFLGNLNGHGSPADRRGLQIILDQLMHALDDAQMDSEAAFTSTLRMGVSEYWDNKVTPDRFFKRAEIALGEARRKQLRSPCYFTEEMQRKLEERITLEADLRSAIHRGELHLVYQPQVCRDGKVVGAEALLRWNHPTLGAVSPSVCIPLAEETDLIVAVGRWVLVEACRTAAAWATVPHLADIVISVNVSSRQLIDVNFVSTVLGALQDTGARGDRLKLEITESSMLTEFEGSIRKMQELRSHQITFSMDDFGTGYSCLANLQLLPLDAIKIDRSFVSDMESNPRSSSIVHTITDLARRLKLSLVAEGLETLSQLEILNKLGCDIYQGFFHSQPLSSAAFVEFVEAREAACRPLLTRKPSTDGPMAEPSTMEDPRLTDEPGRLAALRRYNVLDSPREESFERITGLVKTALNVPMCAVSLIDADRQWFKSFVGLDSCETRRDMAFCTQTITRREPLYVEDALLDPRFAENPAVTGAPFVRSYLGIPLRSSEGYNIGALCALDTVPRRYSSEHIALLRNLAGIVMDELELRMVAQVDTLTGAATRRRFMLELEESLFRSRRTGKTSALVLVDVDHFKVVNDTHGHGVGDIVLQSIALALKSQLKNGETLGRVGGEEFGILLQDVTSAEAVKAAEHLRKCVESATVSQELPLKVSASFGITPINQTIASKEEALELADAALYAAKRAGRNRCVFKDRHPHFVTPEGNSPTQSAVLASATHR